MAILLCSSNLLHPCHDNTPNPWITVNMDCMVTILIMDVINDWPKSVAAWGELGWKQGATRTSPGHQTTRQLHYQLWLGQGAGKRETYSTRVVVKLTSMTKLHSTNLPHETIHALQQINRSIKGFAEWVEVADGDHTMVWVNDEDAKQAPIYWEC